MAGADGGTFPMEPFKAIPNVTIVDSPMFIGGIFYMPFLRDNSEFAAYLSGVPKGHVVFCHQSFNGATFDNGFFDPHGADPKCAEHLGAVICGHIHKKQILGNIYYPGTPFQHSFGEAGQEKSIVMLDLRSKGYSILKEYQLLMPKFYEIKTENLEDLKNKIESILKADLSRSNIKVISQASPSEIAQFWQDPIIKEFRAKARRVVDALTSTKPLNKLSLTKGTTRKEQLDEYIKAKEWRTSADRILSRAREYLTL
jgi:DNA repair exonuclease SbcCD nuclease subunit